MISSLSNLSLVIVGAGVVFVVIGMVVFVRAWFGDRARGRRRCPKCWYSLDGIATRGEGSAVTCPECGTASAERRLYRTRRRRARAVIGAVLVVLGAGAGTVEVVRTTPVSSAPSTVLLVLTGGPAARLVPLATLQAAYVELGERFSRRELAAWQERWVFERELGQLIELPQRWPAGVALPVRVTPVMSMRSGMWPRAGWSMGVRLVAVGARESSDVGGAEWVRFASERVGIGPYSPRVSTAAIPPSAGAMRIEVAVHDETGRAVWSGEVPRVIPMRASVDEVLEPFEGQAANDAMRAMIRLSPEAGSQPRHFSFDGGSRPLGLWDVVFAGRASIVVDGEEIWSDLVLLPNAAKGYSRDEGSMKNARQVLAGLRFRGELARAVVRVTDDPELALSDFSALRRWKGTVEVPLTELLGAGAAERKSTEGE